MNSPVNKTNGFLMVYFPILLRSLRVYIVKQFPPKTQLILLNINFAFGENLLISQLGVLIRYAGACRNPKGAGEGGRGQSNKPCQR